MNSESEWTLLLAILPLIQLQWKKAGNKGLTSATTVDTLQKLA